MILRKIILLTMLLGIQSFVFSQNKNDLYVQLGYSEATQSQNRFNIFQTSYWKKNIHNGYFAVNYYRNITKKYSVGIGTQLVEKGFKNVYLNSFPQYTMKQSYFFKLDYIEFPVMFRYKWKPLYFSIGVLNSYLLKSAQADKFTTTYSNGKIQDYKGTSYNPKVFKKFDIGLIARVGIKIRRNLCFNISLTRGFIRPYIYNSGELNYNEVFLFGFSYKMI